MSASGVSTPPVNAPEGYQLIWSKSKSKYYYHNPTTGHTIWPGQMSVVIPTPPEGYNAVWSTSKKAYYFRNRATGKTVWPQNVAPSTVTVENPLAGLPGTVEENGEEDEYPDGAPSLGTEIVSQSVGEYTNNKGQLSQTNMYKISELVKWNDSIFSRIRAAIERRVCPTRTTCDFNLANYTIKLLGDNSKPTEPEIRDILRQLIALEQIFDGTRVITKGTVPIFQNAFGKSLLVSGATVVISCVVGGIIGVVTGFVEAAVLGETIGHIGAADPLYQEWLKYNPEPTLNSIKETMKAANPGRDLTDADYSRVFNTASNDWHKASQHVQFDIGAATPRGHDILYKATLGTGVGMVVLGTGALAGFLGLPIAAGVIAPAVKSTRAVCKKMNQVMILREIRFILNMACRVPVYAKIYREIEAELNTTLTENPLAVTHGETRASMANFTGAPRKSILKGVTRASMANFTGAKAGGKVRRTNRTKRRKH